MTEFNEPEESREADLESRWESLLRGETSPEEAEALRGEIAAAGREAEFEAQAEVSAAVRALATRHEAPARLRQRLAEMGGKTPPRKAPLSGNVWWGALGGALAASLVFILGLNLLRPKAPAPDLFALVAREARAEFQRAALEPRPIQTGSAKLERILSWFEPRVAFRPKVFFPGNEETLLEGGRVGYAAGAKVPLFIYRRAGKRLALVVFRTKENPAWENIPKKKWVAKTDASPTASVWRRGNFIYSLVGDFPLEKLREISRAITPPEKTF